MVDAGPSDPGTDAPPGSARASRAEEGGAGESGADVTGAQRSGPGADSGRPGRRRVRQSAFRAPPSIPPDSAPQPPASRASAKSARPGPAWQAAERAITPTTLRVAGLLGTVAIAVAGTRAVGIVGVALLVAAWLGVARRTDQLSVRWLTVTAMLWTVPLLVVVPLFSSDGYAYACQGQLLTHGDNPYRYGVADLPCTWLSRVPPVWQHTTTPYGPVWLMLSAMASGLAGPHLAIAIGVLRLIALGGIALTGWAGYQLAREAGTDPGRALWLGAFGPLTLLHGVAGVHNDALLTGLTMVGLVFAVRRFGVAAGIALGLAVAVKVTALVAVPFAVLLLARPLARATAVIGAALAATFAAVTLATGLGIGWLPALSGTTRLRQWTSPATGVGMAVDYLFRAAGIQASAVPVTRAAGLAVLAIVLVVFWLRAWRRRGDARTLPRRRSDVCGTLMPAGVALAALALLSPVFFPWYALLSLAIFGVAAPARARRVLVPATALLALLVLPNGMGIAALTKPVGAFLDLAAVIAVVVWRWHAGRATSTPTAS